MERKNKTFWMIQVLGCSPWLELKKIEAKSGRHAEEIVECKYADSNGTWILVTEKQFIMIAEEQFKNLKLNTLFSKEPNE